MAKTTVDLSDSAVRKQWAQIVLAASLDDFEFPLLVGGEHSVVKIATDLSKGGATGQGNTVTTTITLPLKEEGVVGADTVEGTEEELLWKNFSATIEELNKAVSTGGAMDRQLVPLNFMQLGKDGLKEWYSKTMSEMVIAHLCGNSTYRHGGKTFAQDPTEPTTYHQILANGAASESAISSSDMVTLGTIRAAVQRAKRMWAYAPGASNEADAAHLGYYKIQPMKIEGKDRYIFLMHGLAFEQMRNNYNKGELADAIAEAGQVRYKGWNASAVLDDVVIIASEKVYSPYSNVYRNVLCGKNAATIMFGGAGDNRETALKFVDYTSDAKRYLNFRIETIFGVKKVVFDTIDFATLTVSGYATPLSA